MAAIIGAEIDITLLGGRDLVPMDGSGFFKMGKKTTSDPYCVVTLGGRKHTSKVCPKTLNPQWVSEHIKWNLTAREYKPKENIVIHIFDRDRGSADDPMGAVTLALDRFSDGQVSDAWYKVEPCEGCAKPTGELQVRVSVALRKPLSLKQRESMAIPASATAIAFAMGWDVLRGGEAVDLDTSAVCVSFDGTIEMAECVYFGNLKSQSGAITHTGDEREGDEDLGEGDDEIIIVDLRRLPSTTMAIFFIATVATEGRTFADVKSSKIRMVDWATGVETCRFYPAMSGAHTALFVARLARPSKHMPWALQAQGDFDHTARDWGTLVPEVKAFCQDLLPRIKVDAAERVAVMRKGGAVRLTDFTPAGQLPPTLCLGLAWDVTNGVNIDLDASAILLDANLQQIDLVFFGKLRSSDGSIEHGGDEREGDEKGDDEKIFIHLGRVHPAVKYIGFVINSFSGQELDDVDAASCHLFDPASYRDLATFQLSNTKFLDKHTALVMGVLYRLDGPSNEFAFEVISEARQGRTVQNNVADLQSYLKRTPRRTLAPPRLPPGAAGGMLSRAAGSIGGLVRQLSGKLGIGGGGAPTQTVTVTVNVS